jgi:hypothetical protein
VSAFISTPVFTKKNPPGSANALISSASPTLMVNGTLASEFRTRFCPTRLTYSAITGSSTILAWRFGDRAGFEAVVGAGSARLLREPLCYSTWAIPLPITPGSLNTNSSAGPAPLCGLAPMEHWAA